MRHTTYARLRGFTLIEVMVVVGILIILTAIALPAILIARRKGIETRTRSDLTLIATALEAYKDECHDYPRLADPATDIASAAVPTPGDGHWLNIVQDRGARLLCRALLGPGAAASNSANPTIAQPGDDGADGPGFRMRRSVIGSTSLLGGKIYGPYIQSEKFRLEYDKSGVFTNMQDAKLLDQNGNPILYYVAAPGAPNIASAYTELSYPTSPASPQPLYNSYDNSVDTTPLVPVSAVSKQLLQAGDMQYILGDRNSDGAINGTEKAATLLPYILWTAGADGQYGFGSDSVGNPIAGLPVPPGYGGKIDDITNFDIPADLRK